jgi:DNA-binding transcriptional LysR family regulator
MRDLDLTTLRYLVAACDLGNIARAAEQEHIAPSAISKRIAALEAALGVPLLVRRRRGVAPTPACETLLERARTMLFEMGRIENEMAAFGGGLQGQVRLLATPSAIAEQLLDDVALFMREPANRGITVNIEELFTRDLLRVLRDGSNAIGVCWDSGDLTGLQQRPYRTDDLALAVHAEHPLARRKRLRFEQALDYEHVGLQPTSAVQMALQRAAARVGRTINYRVTVSNFDAAFRVVAANLAISVIPAQVSSPQVASGLVKVVPLSDAWARRRFAICFRDVAGLQGAGRRMVEFLAARGAPPS